MNKIILLTEDVAPFRATLPLHKSLEDREERF